MVVGNFRGLDENDNFLIEYCYFLDKTFRYIYLLTRTYKLEIDMIILLKLKENNRWHINLRKKEEVVTLR